MHPLVARNFFRLQEGLLRRPSFAVLEELRRSQWWPRERLEQLRRRRLRELVRHAYRHSPYWRGLMEARGIDPEQVETLEELRRFPLLDKQTVRRRREEMVWREQGPRLQLVRTSGSTNEALQFYTNSLREAHINAARMRGHEWIGVRRGDKEMYYWGAPVELSKQDRLKRFRDWLVNDGLTNGFEVTAERLVGYFAAWKRFRPKCLFGYPSTFVLTVQLARKSGLELSELKDYGLAVICTTSEMLTEPDRALIAEAFGVPVYDSYGLREVGLIGHECAHGVMHTTDEQVILETIDPETLAPTEGQGELVVTNIVAPVMPLIRYRTGDVVRLSAAPCACGRSLGRIEISGGRIADFVLTDRGKWVVGYSFIYICRSVPGVVKFQVRQERLGEIRLLVATDEEFPADGVARLEQAVRARLDSTDRIVIEIVDDIAPSASGKYRPVVSKVTERILAQGKRQGPG